MSSDTPDFSKDAAADAQNETTLDTTERSELKETDGYDTVSHRKERIDELRDKAIERAEQMRLSKVRGELQVPRNDADDIVHVDTQDRVARTLFRQATEAFVREAFQVIATDEAQSELELDYLHGVNIATVVSDPPAQLINELEKRQQYDSGPQYREFVRRKKQQYQSGKATKYVDVNGLREFVNTDSPFKFTHEASLQQVTKRGPNNTLYQANTYVDIQELQWSTIHDAIEYTTMALDDIGIGFEFDTDDEWEL